MLNNLIPVSGKHSISRAFITLFLPQVVLKPEKVLDKINKGTHLNQKYKRRNLLKAKIFRVSNIENEFAVYDRNLTDPIIGFILEEFDLNGKIENLITLRNDEGSNKSVITFETRNYSRWNKFYSRFLEDFNEIVKDNGFYFEAISLTYIDEFIWDKDEYIPVYEIFEENSELINNKFLKSKNGTIVLLSQNENLNIEEKTEISFNNEIKRIQIIHQHATRFKDLYDEKILLQKIENVLNIAHTSNKETLSSLLKFNVKEKINLN